MAYAKGRMCFLMLYKGFRDGWVQAQSQCHQNSDVFAPHLFHGGSTHRVFPLILAEAPSSSRYIKPIFSWGPKESFPILFIKIATTEFQKLWLPSVGSLLYLTLSQCLSGPGLVSAPFDPWGTRRKGGSTWKLGCCSESLSEWLITGSTQRSSIFSRDTGT